MPGKQRSRVVVRPARLDDLAAVLALVRQHRADAHAEGVLTGQTALGAATAGLRRLLGDPGHHVVLAVLAAPGPGDPLSGPDPAQGGEAAQGEGTAHGEETAVGLAVLGVDPLSLVLGAPQVTVDTFVVHRAFRRRGVGSALLGAAAEHARESGAEHVVVSVAGHEAERQRFFAQMGFAPLTVRRVVPLGVLVRSLAARQRGGTTVPAVRRPVLRRRTLPTLPVPRPVRTRDAVVEA